MYILRTVRKQERCTGALCENALVLSLSLSLSLSAPCVAAQTGSIQQQSDTGGGSCEDQSAYANCALVVSAGLCEHRYYGRYCCASCKAAAGGGGRTRAATRQHQKKPAAHVAAPSDNL